MSPRRGPPPIVWRCPDCDAGVSSRYARKTHVCPPPRPATAGIAGARG